MLHPPRSEKNTDDDSMSRPPKSEEDTEEESYPLVERSGDRTKVLSSRQLSFQRPNIWMFTTFTLAILLLATGIKDYVQSRRHLSRQYVYETGFETDWSKSLGPLAHIHTCLEVMNAFPKETTVS